MRERLKELDIRITELSEYLHISRPTLYKFIEKYEEGKTRGIDSRVMDLFRYIDSNPDIGKKNVISFIINNSVNETSELQKAADEFVRNGGSEEKSQLLISMMESNRLDPLIPNLLKILNGDISESMIETINQTISKHLNKTDDGDDLIGREQ